MDDSRVVQIQLDEVACLASLRQHTGIDVCVEGPVVWVRVQHSRPEFESAILALPGPRYTVAEDGQLTQSGRRVPSGRLPDGPWEPLAGWLGVELPVPMFSGVNSQQFALRLVRGGEPREPQLLLTSIQAWHDYAIQAPQLRLNGLAFAMHEDGQVLVRGRPLPPLRGTRYFEQEGVAVPAGWTWTPAVEASILRQVLKLDSDDLAVFQQEGSWTRLQAMEFVRATRTSVRASLAALPGC